MQFELALACNGVMVRLTSNHERRTKHRWYCGAHRRPCARGSPDGANGWQRIDCHGIIGCGSRGDSDLELTASGRHIFREIGIDTDELASRRRAFCRNCLDWSERRHHLAGAVGAALMQRIIELGWAKRVADSRVIEFSVAGEQVPRKMFVLRENSYADIQHLTAADQTKAALLHSL